MGAAIVESAAPFIGDEVATSGLGGAGDVVRNARLDLGSESGDGGVLLGRVEDEV